MDKIWLINNGWKIAIIITVIGGLILYLRVEFNQPENYIPINCWNQTVCEVGVINCEPETVVMCCECLESSCEEETEYLATERYDECVENMIQYATSQESLDSIIETCRLNFAEPVTKQSCSKCRNSLTHEKMEC